MKKIKLIYFLLNCFYISFSQEGTIIKIIDDKTVEINIGNANGILVGDKFEVTGKGQFLHPATGKVIDSENALLGEISVIEVSLKTSKAAITSSNQAFSINNKVKKTITNVTNNPTLQSSTSSQENNYQSSKAKEEKNEKPFKAPKEKWIYVGGSIGIPLILPTARVEIYPMKVVPAYVGYKFFPMIVNNNISIFHSIDIGISPFKNINKKHKGPYAACNLFLGKYIEETIYGETKYKFEFTYGISAGYQFKKFFIEVGLYFGELTDLEYYNNEISNEVIPSLNFGWMF
jgi:hypothetical protein